MAKNKNRNIPFIGVPKNNKFNGSKHSNRGLAVLTRKSTVSFEGLKKAIAYIPGRLGEDYFQIIFSYLSRVALNEGYVIDNMLVWRDVFQDDYFYNEEEADDYIMQANKVVMDWHKTDNDVQFDAIFSFNQHYNISLSGFHDLSGSGYFSLGCLIHPDNKKAIYRPNSNELKLGILPGYWVGHDENFDAWITAMMDI